MILWLHRETILHAYRHDSHHRKTRKTFADKSAEQDIEFNDRRKFQVETFNVAIHSLTPQTLPGGLRATVQFVQCAFLCKI